MNKSLFKFGSLVMSMLMVCGSADCMKEDKSDELGKEFFGKNTQYSHKEANEKVNYGKGLAKIVNVATGEETKDEIEGMCDLVDQLKSPGYDLNNKKAFLDAVRVDLKSKNIAVADVPGKFADPNASSISKWLWASIVLGVVAVAEGAYIVYDKLFSDSSDANKVSKKKISKE